MSLVSFVVEGVGDCELRTWVRDGESTVMAVSAFRASFRIGDGLFKTVTLEVCVGVLGGDGVGWEGTGRVGRGRGGLGGDGAGWEGTGRVGSGEREGMGAGGGGNSRNRSRFGDTNGGRRLLLFLNI